MFRNRLSSFFYNVPDEGSSPASAPATTTSDSAIDSLWASFSGVSETPPAAAEPQSAGAGNQQPAVQGKDGVVGNTQQTPPVTETPTAAPMAPPTGIPPDQSAAQLAELRGQLNAVMQMAANNQQRAQPQPQQQPQLPDFPVRIPNEVVQAMRSEDPAQTQAALEYLGSNLGSMVLHRAQQDIGNLYQHIQQAIPQMVSAMIAQHTQMQQWHNEFYGDYSELGVSPQMKQLVAQVASGLAQQGRVTKLDKAAGRMVAEEVLRAMGAPPQMIQQYFARKSGAPAPIPSRVHPTIANGQARQMSSGNPLDPNSPEAISQFISGGLQ